MEGQLHRRLRISVAAIFIVVGAQGVEAEGPQGPPDRNKETRVAVYTSPDSAVVEADQRLGSPAISDFRKSSPKRRRCRLERVAGLGEASDQIWAEHPGEALHRLECDGGFAGLVWRRVDPAPGMRRSVAPADIALHLRDEIPMPTVDVRINPDVGLVGTESWFWIEGYEGEPIARSTDAFGRPVEVEARVTRYEWSFGDGGTFAADFPGKPYPQRSSVRHQYERSSALQPDGFPVEVRFIFVVRYRVDGGPWVDLPGISRSATRRYEVQESQAVILR